MSEFLDKTGLSYFWGKLKTLFESKADGNTAGVALNTEGIPFGHVDSTSTATVFTATVPGITEYKDGTVVMLKNGVVTSTTNFTLNINGLGAKPCYTNLAAATRDTTIFNVAYTMLFVYDSTRVSGGAWICYRGYDANTNTIGYQLRTNSTVMNVSDTARYYKMYFMSADNSLWVPASVNSTNNATSARPVNQRPINPFGRIVYTSANTNYAAGANLAAATIWDQYPFNLGYSFNRTGAALTMTVEKPVYLKCAPQTDGSAIMDADTPIVQTLPSTADGKIYIYLGVAYSATNIELVINHPVYYHDGTGIRQWSGAASSGGAVDSVNGQTGAVVLDATDVGALPDTTVIPTKTSDLTNDSGFITSAQAPVQSVSVTQVQTTGTEIAQVSVNGTSTSLYAPSGGSSVTVDSALSSTSENPVQNKVINTALETKQDTLVSGMNIKTINNESLLGSGNIDIQGGGGTAADFVIERGESVVTYTSGSSTNATATWYYKKI